MISFTPHWSLYF